MSLQHVSLQVSPDACLSIAQVCHDVRALTGTQPDAAAALLHMLSLDDAASALPHQHSHVGSQPAQFETPQHTAQASSHIHHVKVSELPATAEFDHVQFSAMPTAAMPAELGIAASNLQPSVPETAEHTGSAVLPTWYQLPPDIGGIPLDHSSTPFQHRGDAGQNHHNAAYAAVTQGQTLDMLALHKRQDTLPAGPAMATEPAQVQPQRCQVPSQVNSRAEQNTEAQQAQQAPQRPPHTAAPSYLPADQHCAEVVYPLIDTELSQPMPEDSMPPASIGPGRVVPGLVGSFQLSRTWLDAGPLTASSVDSGHHQGASSISNSHDTGMCRCYCVILLDCHVGEANSSCLRTSNGECTVQSNSSPFQVSDRTAISSFWPKVLQTHSKLGSAMHGCEMHTMLYAAQ